MPSKRSLAKLTALGAGVLALALAAGTLTVRQEGGTSSPVRSTHNAAMPGVKAFYELLCRTEAARPLRLKAISQLLDLRGVLIVVGPLEEPMNEAEAEKILAWVHAGNGLLYFIGDEKPDRLHSALEDRLAVQRHRPSPALTPVEFQRVPAQWNGGRVEPAGLGQHHRLHEQHTSPEPVYCRGRQPGVPPVRP